MTNTLSRWECPACERWHALPNHHYGCCPGVPVERTYVSVDALLDHDAVIAACVTRGDWTPAMQRGMRSFIRAAINAVTGENA